MKISLRPVGQCESNVIRSLAKTVADLFEADPFKTLVVMITERS